MRRVYEVLDRISDSAVTVLITGESGTGKELVARALHRRGSRCDGPFVAINCAAMPESLLESELFGHVRGAFTDARTSRVGLLLRAHRGTLLLDEIGEMPPGMQAKLLRALEERRVRPVGGSDEVPFDARIVAATNRDLAAAVEAGAFREDLYFRLNVMQIDLPPLRARGNDVLLLAQRFLERSSHRAGRPVIGIAPEAARKLLAYHWPGNVRELHNCMERAVALARYEQITVDDLPERITAYRPARIDLPSGEDPDNLPPLDEIDRRYVVRVLEAVGGHRARAAAILGVDRKTLYRKLERWNGAPPGDED
jgi:two-component system response regulator HydG